MNNPKTIEAIQEIIDLLNKYRYGSGDDEHFRSAQQKLEQLKSCLQEPTSDEHPLHAGWVLIDGQKRELRRGKDDRSCPFCVNPKVWECKAYVFAKGDDDVDYWLAPPPPAPVKEPELDEFEKCLVDEMPDESHSDYNKGARDAYMWCQMKYREIVKQQGAH